ncbi:MULTISPECIES: hypothetical protein [Streptomyces]|uniref:hypothetical protein n=1 Tax=Streptomyces TaxID=1883 RepID=UPI0019ABEF23|nr:MULTISPECIES: hypothetical protein [Streptomyces]MCM3266884.1 hypothetical protein [Streptomyces thermoviolaceus]GHA94647.1 hypothetical protein GCM10010512_27630 [Streptomyces thermoviolaceus subsp. thermoviolaceus]
MTTGLALFPALATTMFIASALSDRLSRRTGDRPLVVSGLLLAFQGDSRIRCWRRALARPTR